MTDNSILYRRILPNRRRLCSLPCSPYCRGMVEVVAPDRAVYPPIPDARTLLTKDYGSLP